MSGIYVEWRANPALPGPISDEISVLGARFQIDHLRVTADEVNSNTTRSQVLLSWTSDGPPQMVEFPDAAVALYSLVTIALSNGRYGEYAYEIEGTWTHDGVTKRYEIEDKSPLIFGLPCSISLSPGGMATLVVELDLKEALGEIDFEDLREGDGKLELKEGQQLVDFRDRLENAFKVNKDASMTRPGRPAPRKPRSNPGGRR